jgi:hypothetical protein
MLGPFRIGEQPSDALELLITRPGDDQPLSGFTSAKIQMRIPDGTIQEWNASLVVPNIIQAAWPSNPFTQSGLHRIRAKLIGSGSVNELASWVRFWVRT